MVMEPAILSTSQKYKEKNMLQEPKRQIMERTSQEFHTSEQDKSKAS